MADDTNTAERAGAYDMIDRFLRNNLSSDEDYAEYSKALDLVLGASLAASAGSEPVAPSEDVQKKIQSNTWDHFGAILPTLKAISRGDWYWGANSRCKYIEIRLDTRDGGCLLFDRERVRISPEQFAHQSYGGFKMDPWPATGLTHPSPPEGMAGWKPIETAPKGSPFTPGPRFLLFIKGMGPAFGHVYDDGCGGFFANADGYSGRWEITHWMPSPPAPPLPASEAKEL